MLSVKLVPAWKSSVGDFCYKVLKRYEELRGLNDGELAKVAELFKPHAVAPWCVDMNKIMQHPNGSIISYLARMVDNHTGKSNDLDPNAVPKVTINHEALLELACMTALSPENEIQAFLECTWDRETNTVDISRSTVAPKQLVKEKSVRLTVEKVVSDLATVRMQSKDEVTCKLHGDFHSHLHGQAASSEDDLSMIYRYLHPTEGFEHFRASGTSKWWVGLIGNLGGTLYVSLWDEDNRKFYFNLPWEIRAPISDAQAFVKDRILQIFCDAQKEIFQPLQGGGLEPDGNDHREPGEVIMTRPAEQVDIAAVTRASRKETFICYAAFAAIALAVVLYVSGGSTPETKLAAEPAIATGQKPVAGSAVARAPKQPGEPQVTVASPAASSVPAEKAKVETPAVVAAVPLTAVQPVQPAPKTPETAAQGAHEANKVETPTAPVPTAVAKAEPTIAPAARSPVNPATEAGTKDSSGTAMDKPALVKVGPTTGDTGSQGVAPQGASQGAREARGSEAIAKVETPAVASPPVKPEPATSVVPATPATAPVVPAAPPTPVVTPAPALKPWQFAIIEQNKGLKMATRSPMPLFDPKDFRGVNVEEWRNRTVKDIVNWNLTREEHDRTPNRVVQVLYKLWDLNDAYLHIQSPSRSLWGL